MDSDISTFLFSSKKTTGCSVVYDNFRPYACTTAVMSLRQGGARFLLASSTFGWFP